jgi:uncharacterized phiE125 gp8 family phage protein
MRSGNYIRDVKITTAGTEPVGLDTDVKPHLNIDHTDDDTLLTALISKCRKAIENYTGVSLTTHTVVVTADLCEEIELPHGPINAITTVKVRTGTDIAGAATYDTLTAANDYTLDGDDFKRLCSNREGRHVITYTTKALSEMDDLKLALLNEIAYRYEHKGDEIDNSGICVAAMNLANPYRRMTWV